MTDEEARANWDAAFSLTPDQVQDTIEKRGYALSLEEGASWHPKWQDSGKNRPAVTVEEMVEPTADELEAMEDLGVDCETYLADCAAGPQPVEEHVGT